MVNSLCVCKVYPYLIIHLHLIYLLQKYCSISSISVKDKANSHAQNNDVRVPSSWGFTANGIHMLVHYRPLLIHLMNKKKIQTLTHSHFLVTQYPII